MKIIKKTMRVSNTPIYTGINVDEKTAQKIKISKSNIAKISYYPEISMKKNKKYTLIATSSI
jgi:hypothetical protein